MQQLLIEQQNECDSCEIYRRLSESLRDPNNKALFLRISREEHKHYEILRKLTGKELKPNKAKVRFFFTITRLFGLTFGVKLLEKGEADAGDTYGRLAGKHPAVSQIIADEEEHEQELIAMIDEEKLNYVGSVVLGLNDALVELTGALAGFTFAFQNTRLIAVTGLITGISASFSMAASEYLSTVQESGDLAKARKSALYTGLAYILTVMVLILPFILIANPFISLACCLLAAVLIIFMFNYYVSVAKDTPFRRRFLEMAAISLGVSAISFLIGMLVKQVFGLEI